MKLSVLRIPRLATAGLLFVSLLVAPATAESQQSEQPQPPDTEELEEAAEASGDEAADSEVQQDEFGFIHRTVVQPEDPPSFEPYSVVFALNRVLSYTGLNPQLESEAKVALSDHLFGGFPLGEQAVYREVAVPGYFENDDPLVFQLRALKSGSEAKIEADGVLVIQTNIAIDRENEKMDVGSGNFRELKNNVSFIFAVTPDNALISVRKLHDPSLAPDTIDDETDPNRILSAAENWIYDQRDDNLEDARRQLESLLQREDIDPSYRAIAMMHRFQYYLRRGAPEKAAETLQEARELDAPEVRDKLDRIIENEAEDMLTVYRRLTER